MNTIGPEQLLSQIRSMSKSMDVSVGMSPQLESGERVSTFGSLIKSTINSVNDAQSAAAELKAGMVTQTSDASLAEVMIASQKADLSFRAAAAVRNKLVQAYQDIMNMPV